MSNSVILLYHGSEQIIENPVFGYGKANNDYGRAFYCTEDLGLAKEWACKNDLDGYANKYHIDLNGLKVLDLDRIDHGLLTWITILVENRTFESNSVTSASAKEYLVSNYHIGLDEYDLIKGYRADDSYFQFASGFLNNQIDLDTLEWAMRLGDLGEQVAVRSEKAFDRLQFDGTDFADAKTYYPIMHNRDAKTRKMFMERANSMVLNQKSIFMADIVRGRGDPNDPRL